MPNNALKTSQIKDSQITLAKMANGTPGSIPRYSAGAGVPVDLNIYDLPGIVDDLLIGTGVGAIWNQFPVVTAPGGSVGAVRLASNSDVTTATNTIDAITPASLAFNSGVADAVAVITKTPGVSLAIVNSHNMASITDLSSNTYRLTFSSAMSSADYGVMASGTIGISNHYTSVIATTTTTIDIWIRLPLTVTTQSSTAIFNF